MTELPLPSQGKLSEDYDIALQDLWPQYLAALDRYTAAQADVARIYSSVCRPCLPTYLSVSNITGYILSRTCKLFKYQSGPVWPNVL